MITHKQGNICYSDEGNTCWCYDTGKKDGREEAKKEILEIIEKYFEFADFDTRELVSKISEIK